MSEGPHVFTLLSQNISHFPEPGNSFPSLAGTSFRGPESGFREAPLSRYLMETLSEGSGKSSGNSGNRYTSFLLPVQRAKNLRGPFLRQRVEPREANPSMSLSAAQIFGTLNRKLQRQENSGVLMGDVNVAAIGTSKFMTERSLCRLMTSAPGWTSGAPR